MKIELISTIIVFTITNVFCLNCIMDFEDFLNNLCCCFSIKIGGCIIGWLGLIGSVTALTFSTFLTVFSSALTKMDWDEITTGATIKLISKEEYYKKMKCMFKIIRNFFNHLTDSINFILPS